MPDLTAQFQQRIVWDRGSLQPVTTRIEYEAVAKDSAAGRRPAAGSSPRGKQKTTQGHRTMHGGDE